MKKLLAILFVLLLCTPAALADGDEYWTTKDDPHYHAEEYCGGTAGMRPISLEGAKEFGKYPCPACIQAGTNACGPAWCADPATYNSQMDAYKDRRSILVGNSVYTAEWYVKEGTMQDGDSGEVLLHMDADGDASGIEVVRDMGSNVAISGKKGIFDLGDGILFQDYHTGDIHKIDYTGENDRVLFTTKTINSPFLILVNDRLYCMEGRTLGYYSIASGSFTPIYEIDPNLEIWSCQVEYAEGKLLVLIYSEDSAFYAIDVSTGACVNLADTLGTNLPFDFLALNGRVYLSDGDGRLLSAKYDGSDVQVLTMSPEDSCYVTWRAYDRYVFVTNQSYTPSENIYIAEADGELRFEPSEMQRALYSDMVECILGGRIYIERDEWLDGYRGVYLYDSRDLSEYIAEQLANPPEEKKAELGW